MSPWWKTLLGTFILGTILVLAACNSDGGSDSSDSGGGGGSSGAMALPERVSVVEDSGSQ